MKITKVGIFAYATEGEALKVANSTVEETGIAEIRIIRGISDIAYEPVAWIVLRESLLDTLCPADFDTSQMMVTMTEKKP